MNKLKIGIVTFIAGASLAGAASATASVWQGTSWIANGGVISAAKIKSNFDYLKEQVAKGGPWRASGQNIFFNTGNIGVGITPSSTVKLYAYQTGNRPAIYGVTTGASYGVYGQSAANYGIYGRTFSASHGGVLGYSANLSSYGILGHANAYALYGRGQIYVTDRIRTPNDVWAKRFCDQNGANCFKASDVRPPTPPPATPRCTAPSGLVGSTYTTWCGEEGPGFTYLCLSTGWAPIGGYCNREGP